MKVGIVTFTFGDNYGQRLQNYAVQELLQRRERMRARFAKASHVAA